MRKKTWLVCAGLGFFLYAAGTAAAQTRYNPDISIIGDFRGVTADRPRLAGLEQKAVLQLHEVELAAQGYLNPYARADIFFAWHEGAAEIEEAYVTFERGLPWGLSLRAGRYLANFGRLNLLHPHAYSFVERPLVHHAYLGDHGFVDDGVSLRWLLPICAAYVELSADLLRGDAFSRGLHHHEDAAAGSGRHPARTTPRAAGSRHQAHDEEGDPPPDKGLLSHLSLAGAVGEFAEAAAGISFAYGNHDPAHNLKTVLLGADLKYKYKPGRYTSLVFMAEVLLNRRETLAEQHEANDQHQDHEPAESTEFFGAYAVLDYQFRQRYNAGVKFDYLEPLENKENTVTQFQAFLGFAPVEETSLIRLSGYLRNYSAGRDVFGAMVQLIFALGPHRPHYF